MRMFNALIKNRYLLSTKSDKEFSNLCNSFINM